jgi:hypothetical protein
MVAARLERYINGASFCSHSGITQSHDFRMGITGELMPALPDHSLSLHNHTTDPGIGVGAVQTLSGQTQRASHALMVKPRKIH